MATTTTKESNISSGSSGSSDEDPQLQGDDDQVMDIRKRKRMISNRESARRSRQRKQQHLDNLTVQVNQLKIQNSQILSSTNTTTQLYLNVEAENCILRAQLNELTNRLNSLNDIIRCLTTTAAAAATASESDDGFGGFDLEIDDGFSMNSWGFSFANCSVMPAMDAFMC